MFIVTNRKFFYAISGLIMLGSIVALSIWGLNLSVDFKGGSIFEVAYLGDKPSVDEIHARLKSFDLGEYSVRETGESGYILRMRTLDEKEHTSILNSLSLNGKEKLEEKRFNSVGPLLGKEAAGKSLISIILVIVAIVIFITFVFRKVSEPVASWKYGLITIFALLHDVLVPAGVFEVLGHFVGVQVDTLFVTALLVILGFSVHDTIVVFDRVRENLRINHEYREKKPFDVVVGESINQTFVRSINTSLTTILALVILYFIGGEVTRYFSLALIIGIIAGTYSSIFLGSPLLVTVEKWQHKKPGV